MVDGWWKIDADDDDEDDDDDDDDDDVVFFLTPRRAVERARIWLPENCSKSSGCSGDQNEHF